MSDCSKFDIRWEFIAERINESRCVLLLNNDFYSQQGDESMMQQMLRYLKEKGGSNFNYFPNDEFFSFRNNSEKRYTYFDIKQFYQQLEKPAVLEKIAEIPFHLMISLSPDHMLKSIFESFGMDFNFDYYSKKRNSSEVAPASKEKPLIYNLLGSINDDDSMVFGYEDIFDYLIAILGEFRLAENLKREFQKADTYIFLGFKHEKWYLKLLLRLLGLHQDKVIHSISKKELMDKNALNFYTEMFNVHFINADETEFINCLHSQYNKKFQLRERKDVKLNKFSDKIRGLLAEDLLDEAIDEITFYIEDHDTLSDFLDQITMISGNYAGLSRKIAANRIKPDDADIQTANIRYSIQELVKQIDEG